MRDLWEFFEHSIDAIAPNHALIEEFKRKINIRFKAELVRRRELNLPEYPVDERFLAALRHGIPDCSGVALGVDRLLMLKTGAKTIQDVMPFPIDVA